MNTPTQKPSVQEVEKALLRKGWWLFPVTGLGLGLVQGGPFWKWVEGGLSFSIPWSRLLSADAVGLALLFCLVPMAWAFSLKIRCSRWRILLLVIAVVMGADLALRSEILQSPLWLAARARLEPDQSFMREACYVRLEEAAGRQDDRPSVLLMGSSQVLWGVDEQQLRKRIEPKPVIRRAMYGMTPLKALSMLAYVPLRADDLCVQYLSELDFTNQDEFPYAWFRPYASWSTWPDVIRCVGPAVAIRQWRHVLDYAMAASFECFRDRDFLRQIAFHFWGKDRSSDDAVLSAVPVPVVSQSPFSISFVPGEKRACERFLEKLSERKVNLLVFEGEVNPVLHSPERLMARTQTREELVAGMAKKGFRYVSREEQGLSLGADYWHDMTHLNAAGRELLTQRIAQEILDGGHCGARSTDQTWK